MLSKPHLCWFKVGSRWWHAEKPSKRLPAKAVLLAVGTLGIRLAVCVRTVAIPPTVGGAPVALDTVIWMARASLFSTDLCPGFTAAACKAWNSRLCEKSFYESNQDFEEFKVMSSRKQVWLTSSPATSSWATRKTSADVDVMLAVNMPVSSQC